MAAPVTSVIFQPDAPLGVLKHKLKSREIGGEVALYINCTEVHETNFGFLQLVPVEDVNVPVIAIFVPPNYIMYMLRHERPAQMGFV